MGCPADPDDKPDAGQGTPDAGQGTPDAGQGTPDAGQGTPDGGGELAQCFKLPKDWPTGVMYGEATSEELLDVVVDPKGDVYLSGYKGGTVGRGNIDPTGDARGVVLKVGGFDQDGVPTLFTEFPVNVEGSTETVDALTIHPTTGELYMVGRTTGAFPNSTFTNQGQQDAFVGLLEGQSRVRILYQGGTERPQHPNRLAFDGHGDLIVSGFDDIYVPTNYVDSWEDPFVFKLRRPDADSPFSLVWWLQPNTAYTDTLGGLAVETGPASSIYVTGVNASGTRRGSYVQKLNSDSTEAWFQKQTSINLDMMQAAHVQKNGSVVIAGSTFARLGQDPAYGDQDVVVRSLNPATGIPEWTRQFGSAESEWVTDMTVDAHGNIYVVGETLGSLTSEPNHGDYDAFLLKLDQHGNELGRWHWGSPGDDRPSGVAADACGQAFVVGYTTGNLFGDVMGQRDAFAVTTAKRDGSP